MAVQRKPDPEPWLATSRRIHETVLAHVLATQRQRSKAADRLAFRLQELADAIETGEALAVSEALFRLGSDCGKAAGRIALRRVRQRAGAKRGRKVTDEEEDRIFDYWKQLNGGQVPKRAGYRTVMRTAHDLNVPLSRVKRIIGKRIGS